MYTKNWKIVFFVGESVKIGINVSEGFPEEVTAELDYEEHVGVIHIDKEAKQQHMQRHSWEAACCVVRFISSVILLK